MKVSDLCVELRGLLISHRKTVGGIKWRRYVRRYVEGVLEKQFIWPAPRLFDLEQLFRKVLPVHPYRITALVRDVIAEMEDRYLDAQYVVPVTMTTGDDLINGYFKYVWADVHLIKRTNVENSIVEITEWFFSRCELAMDFDINLGSLYRTFCKWDDGKLEISGFNAVYCIRLGAMKAHRAMYHPAVSALLDPYMIPDLADIALDYLF